MSVIVAVKKNNRICIAADTLSTRGNIKVSSRHIRGNQKIYKLGESYIGVVGWQAIVQIVEHIIINSPNSLNLSSRGTIFESLLALQGILKEKYYIETQENEEQPVESNQMSAIIINRNGIFEIDSYREVHEMNEYWAIGSGSNFALGAMNALYDKDYSPEEIATEGVISAAEFDDGCGLPLTLKTICID